jgi:hypothetical protein
MLLAVSAAGEAFGLIVIAGLLAVAVICAMKGKWAFFALGWFSGIFWIIGASRLAKPNSYWARRRYGELEMAEAERRFSRRLIPRRGKSPYRAD